MDDVCRDLEISHLWIDALCMVQEDPQGWRHEAAKMADTFRNGYLTLTGEVLSSVDYAGRANSLLQNWLSTASAGL